MQSEKKLSMVKPVKSSTNYMSQLLLIFITISIALVFFILVIWLIGFASEEDKLTDEIRSLNNTMHQIASKMPSLQELSENKEEVVAVAKEASTKPVTIESVRTALRYNGIPSEIPDPEEPDNLRVTFNGSKYRLGCSKLPFITILWFFGIDKEHDVELMKEAAQYVSIRAYGACVFVVPEENCYFIGTDIYADSYLYLRNNIRFFLEVVENTGRYFYNRYEELKDQKKKSSKEAVNNAFIAAQIEMAGNKTPS